MSKTWVVIIGMTLATLLPRVIPLLLLPGRRMPRGIERWLSLVAPAIMAALLAPELLLVRDTLEGPAFSLFNLNILAAVPTFWVAWKTKSLFGAVATGIAASALLRLAL